MGHAKQGAWPAADLYVPTAHPVQPMATADWFALVYPGRHRHATPPPMVGVELFGHGRQPASRAAVQLYQSNGALHGTRPEQFEQLPGPAAALNLPVRHAVHGPPARPAKPAAHTHADDCQLPTAAVVMFAGHSVHAEAPPAAYEPNGHWAHAPAPADG